MNTIRRVVSSPGKKVYDIGASGLDGIVRNDGDAILRRGTMVIDRLRGLFVFAKDLVGQMVSKTQML